MSDSPHALEQLAASGPWGGPSYRYRGAEILCLPGGRFCGLMMPTHPLTGRAFGAASRLRTIVDVWLDENRLPSFMWGRQR